ncbi:MAG: histidine kinase [Acidobacteria bacterium]|nr:histidine kinase [Acidobacteriota bacterium]
MSAIAEHRPGRLRVYLGYAAGVGKTYKMLEESQRLRGEGKDVVVGYFEPHGRKDTIEKTQGLEFVPRKTLVYRGVKFEEMDTEAILARRPEICAVDEFPHTNVPGSGRAKRWEDVKALLDAGIHVMTTMNIQHLESLNDQIREITGVEVRETIPDWVMKSADEVVLIDLPPGALLNRLQRGAVYAPEKAQRAMDHFFKEEALAALRELALRQTAHEAEIRQGSPEHRDDQEAGDERQERILLHLTESPATAGLIRRGKRVADYLKAECVGVCVLRPGSLSRLTSGEREALERHLDFARKLHVETRVLEGENATEALVDFARRNSVTQIYLARPPRQWLPMLGKRHFVMRVVEKAKDMQVTVVADRRRQRP